MTSVTEPFQTEPGWLHKYEFRGRIKRGPDVSNERIRPPRNPLI